ncbi:MAG: elongation factor EF-2 [Ignisphaera sp.]|uniref:Elongation factor 2 n=1 Tax=Ignisphaera aggregans TaxID=334771 RepID=A0A7J3JQ34_9CREN
MRYVKTVDQVLKIMNNIEQIRNVGIIAHVDHGKTTTTDSLLAAAGIISPRLAGQVLAMDFLDVEQRRQMTVKAANISLYHEYEGKPYVINLVDTPGHVDFTGKVTRSLRMIDGAIVVVDAVEGVMTQTETVLRQALEERIRPLLFINKVDRLIKELRMGSDEIKQRFIEIIKEINNLIETYAEPEFKKKWILDPVQGMVAFGSARDAIGLTVPMSRKKGVKVDDLIEAYSRGDKDAIEDLKKKIPLHEALLDMVVKFVPNPKEAQRYRIPRLWKGETNSEIGKAMMEADPDGPLIFFVCDMRWDPHAGFVATGRLFSGTVYSGQEVYLINAKSSQRVLQVGLYMGPYREVVDRIPAGNVAAILGPDLARAGETIVDIKLKDTMVPFERLRYVSEPVVTMAIEPKKTTDLTKLMDALKKMSIEDPNLIVKINEETGEYLVSGMGHLHLEIVLTLLRERFGLDVDTTQPTVVYRETIRDKSTVFEGKSPNRHNRFYISVEPLNEESIRLIQQGIVTEDMDVHKRAKILRDEAGWDHDEARRVWAIDENINIFVDRTSGIQYLREVRDTIIQGFRLAMREGPLALEPVRGLKVVLHDAIIHEDPAHRGPAQIYPAVRNPIYAAMLSSRPTLLEPIQKLEIKFPIDYLGPISAIITKRRGRIINVVHMIGNLVKMLAEVPVAESLDLANELRSASAGKAFWGTEFSRWAVVPDSLLLDIIKKLRQRKGVKPEPPRVEDFLSP